MNLLSTVPFDEAQLARLKESDPNLNIQAHQFVPDPRDVTKQLTPETDILYTFRVPHDVLEKSPSIKWVQLLSAGCDHLKGHAILNSDVDITTGSGIHATPIAEYVLASILALYRGLNRAFRAQIKHEWLREGDVMRGTRELRNRTVGIIGYGAIGREVARLAKPFGTRILALKRDKNKLIQRGVPGDEVGDPQCKIPDQIYGPEELTEMLGLCDVVVIAVPMTADTKHLLGAKEFASMKDQSYLINIARGSVVDEAALTQALQSGKLAGAGLDVFEKEPLDKNSDLWDMENVIVTPHVSGASRRYLRRAFEILAENLGRQVRNEPLINLVDHKQGY